MVSRPTYPYHLPLNKSSRYGRDFIPYCISKKFKIRPNIVIVSIISIIISSIITMYVCVCMCVCFKWVTMTVI